ncbi:flagellar basal-body MS-ring/collar protein FliF [Pseudovibrio sp. Tun.PSC04-5.I4]|uniref:flagellar basal-body MS-ring/collar protein FliF n=1 Tax=Pseudovibrio sp. Tun.PSC04-5.I4 TaxID=1798213 RepID=UPI00088A628D|nr:flagellar basal-body MS-ring/collar protein FliF [Pseudovibrio sp. Tun.PSC04-5.I4]SDR33891.1 flagellar M-ring protein FliF [Pseudovibrio sp. Tun.PSC04-5.I4]
MNGLLDFLKGLGPARLAAMGAMAALLIGLFAFIIVRATAPQMVPLFTDLTLEDAGAIVSQVESQGITYELGLNGSSVLVPEEDVYRLRMSLAEAGLPSGGGVGYEIFDKTDTLGATSFVQNINRLRALEGELSRTIRSISRIVSARVHLVLPEKQLFQRDKEPPTASITIKAQGTLTNGQIRAIQHLVATAVEGLEPSYVAIVDERGSLLASGTGDKEGLVGGSSLDERRLTMEARLRQQVEEILNNVVGAGRARVRVAAEINFNRKTETQELFDPDGQVLRSSQSKEENASSANTEDTVSVANQLPNAAANNGTAGTKENSNISEEILNYEISKSTVTEVYEAGGLERLSVAVLVDGTYITNEDGTQAYQARTKEDLEQIATLVRTAVGFNKRRGDTVEIVNMRFVEAPVQDLGDNEGGLFDFTRADIMKLAELGVLLVITILLLIFAVSPLMKRILASEERKDATAENGYQVLPDGTVVRDAPAQIEGIVGEMEGVPSEIPTAEWIEDAKNQAALHQSSIKQISEMIDESPSEAVNIVRGWLNEAA